MFWNLVAAAPLFFADEEVYLEMMRPFPLYDEPLRIVRAVWYSLLHPTLPPAKRLQLTIGLLAWGNDKSVAIIVAVYRAFIWT